MAKKRYPFFVCGGNIRAQPTIAVSRAGDGGRALGSEGRRPGRGARSARGRDAAVGLEVPLNGSGRRTRLPQMAFNAQLFSMCRAPEDHAIESTEY